MKITIINFDFKGLYDPTPRPIIMEVLLHRVFTPVACKAAFVSIR